MFSLNDTMRYYLCPGPTCMRKGINGLCGVVHEQMGCNVKNGDVFIFINKECKTLLQVLGPKHVAEVFFGTTGRQKQNYYPKIYHFYSLLLSKYVH